MSFSVEFAEAPSLESIAALHRRENTGTPSLQSHVAVCLEGNLGTIIIVQPTEV